MLRTKLQRLYEEQGQSPWLDNLTRPYLLEGTLARMVSDGIRGVTSNPTIFAKAIAGSDAYDEQFGGLTAEGRSVEDAYWEVVLEDIGHALGVLRPTYDESRGDDGYVSVEVAPELAHDTAGTIAAARNLHERIARPNLLVKIPATAAGVPAIQAMVAEGRNINVTLIFSLKRYGEVMEAYLSGLESFARAGGDVSRVHGVASFFVSRVDSEVDKRLAAMSEGGDKGAGDGADRLLGKAAVSQAQTAYQDFRRTFSGERWKPLAAAGAHLQRPLWASTSTKNPAYPDTMYVDELIGPDTVNTLPEKTINAFEDRGVLARTVDQNPEGARQVLDALRRLGIDMEDVGQTLEDQGVSSFHESFQELLAALSDKSRALARR